MKNWKILFPSFLILLLLFRYYDFFYIYIQVRQFTVKGYDTTLGTFLAFNYLLKVIFYLFKLPMIALVLSAGIFLEGSKNKENIASFGNLLSLSLGAEFIYFLSDLFKIIYFTFINTNYSEQDYTNFHPLSLFSFLETDSSSSFANLFQTLNLFELGYIICLVAGLRKLQYPDLPKAATVTLYSYGGMLFLWVLITTYFSLWEN